MTFISAKVTANPTVVAGYRALPGPDIRIVPFVSRARAPWLREGSRS
ncbi:hypothetical protein [Nocardia sp. NPDC024068]